jgi:arylsulfatase A-like enzyme
MRASLLGAGLTALAAGCGSEAPAGPPPSVILVSIDTLRADHVGLYGYERDTTPWLDRFAEQATVFEHAFTVCPWTLVAHMTMLTGLFPTQHGVVTEELALNGEIPLLAERLRTAGYQTLALFVPSWLHERFGFARGFDVFRSHGSAEEAALHLKEELARLDRTRPFFLFYHLFDVHNGPMASGEHMIYPSPEPFQEMFLPGATARLPKIAPDELWDSQDLLKADEIEALVALYDGGIRHVDTRLGEAFAWLEGEGYLANTLVIVTSDHGEALAQRGRLVGHGELAQEGLHVPLVVRHPQGRDAGKRVAAVAHLGDLVPTVLDVAGLPADRLLPGRSLFGPLPPERVVTGVHLPSEFVVRWPEKIIHQKGRGNVAFDLERDPRELSGQRAPKQRYEELLEQAFPKTPFPPPVPMGGLPPEERDALRALGYGGQDEDQDEEKEK